jgi:hypothetical protein
MLSKIDLSKASQNVRNSMLFHPPVYHSKTGFGHIIALNDDVTAPLYVRRDNGAIFALGGLSDLQREQIPILMPELIGAQLMFKYEFENHLGQPVDAQFTTLLIEGDSRTNAAKLRQTLESAKGAVQ